MFAFNSRQSLANRWPRTDGTASISRQQMMGVDIVRTLDEIARSLYIRLAQAEAVPFRQVGIGDGSQPDDWQPAPNICYDNVDIWVRRSPECKALRGWAIFDLRRNPFCEPQVQFAGHSVIEMPDCTLIDITPSGVSRQPQFLRHDGSFEEFEELRMKHIPLRAHYFIT
jgi:hypothetical protein